MKCARLPLLSILSDKNCRAYEQLSIFARLMSISTGVKNKMLLDGENKREWGLEQSGVLVSGRFFCSCSLRSFFLASIFKVIATAPNLKASVGSRSVESVYLCFLMTPHDI